MAIGIYKAGQGYWVRVMTATLLGVVTLGLAGWAWSQTRSLISTLPRAGFETDIKNVSAPLPENATVRLLGPAAGNTTEDIGTARLASPLTLTPPSSRVELRDLAPREGKNLQSALAIVDPATDTRIAEITGRSPIYAFNPDLAATAVISVIIIIGAILTYWLVALRPQTVDFLVATDFEMKRVNWSTRREIVGSTWVVIGACILLSGMLFLFDVLLKTAFSAVNLLRV
ncbi:hypothetical protein BH11PLA1_BH11PLA1_20010 [soil metagenome]